MGTLEFIGALDTIADRRQQWLDGRGSDGFNVMLSTLPQGFDDRGVPELPRRGIFCTEYEGRTLRESLGLPWPRKRYF